MTSFLFLWTTRDNPPPTRSPAHANPMNILLIKNLVAGTLMASVANTSPMTILSSAMSQNSSAEATSQSAPDAMDAWLQKLIQKESEGREHIKILDHNNQYSYGCLQFQMATFRSYIRKYKLLANTEDAERENMIYDCEFQQVLARKMIEDDYSNWRNWYTSVSVRNLGLPPRVSAQLAEK